MSAKKVSKKTDSKEAKKKSRKIPEKSIKALWGLAASRCAFESCKVDLTLVATKEDEMAIIGEMAHIEPFSSAKGPRASSTPTDNSYENLILLCPNCHTKIDKQPSSYPASILRDIKTKHENWVRERLKISMLDVGFAELTVITKAILVMPISPNQDLKVIAPREKIKKNHLSAEVGNMISMGMVKSPEVEKYIKTVIATDISFPERLRAGFVDEYNKLLKLNLSPDDVFYGLLQFASQGSKGGFKEQAAGLAVLVYLFQKCEVFEH